MINRLKRGCVVLVCLYISVLIACGDDEGSSSGSASTAGTSAPDAGRWVNQRPVRAESGTTGSAGRQGNLGGQMCPMTEAEATGSCTAARGTCMFGERTCDCSMETMMWACWAPSDCPTTVPAEQSACSIVGMACPQPNMRGRNCTCTQQGWDCGNQFCPPAEPAAGGTCDEGTGNCTYGARMCECTNEQWVCWDPKSDCPAAPPADRAMCSLEGVVCEYEGGSCNCRGSSGWRCGRGVMNDVEDAGVPQGGTPGTGTGGAGTAGSTAGTPSTGGAGATAAGAGASGAGAGANAGASGAP